jgi:hypothetical protein
VLYSHGNAENIGVLQQVAPQFIEHGYNLMVWDYRGYGLSTGKLGGQAALLADAEDVYNWLILREDANKIVFYGRSLGSGVAVYLASKHPGHKVMLESAYDSLLAVGQDHNRIFPLRLLKYPMPAALWVSGVSAPIYIIHGTSDHIIPVKHAIALAKAAPNATVTLIEGAGHNGLSHEPEYADWLSKGLE